MEVAMTTHVLYVGCEVNNKRDKDESNPPGLGVVSSNGLSTQTLVDKNNSVDSSVDRFFTVCA